MKYNRVDMKHLFPSLQMIIGGRSDWIIQYLRLAVDCNVRKCLASTWAQMLQTSACIRVCASDVSFIHLSLCPRGQSPTQRETKKSMTLESKAKCNIHLYLFRKETQTILWQIYTCMQEWDSCDMPGQLLRVCVCIEVLRDPITASWRPLCCGLHVNNKVPVVNNRIFFISLSFPSSKPARSTEAQLPLTR